MFSPEPTPCRLELRPYRLRFRAPWPGLKASHRRGWLLHLHCGSHHGWGECAPLPAAGTESPRTASRRLAEACARRWNPLTLARHARRLARRAPAAACALETALLDLESRRRRLPLRRLLEPRAMDRFPVNAMAGHACDPRAGAAARQGFRVIKLKVGRGDLEEELGCLRACCARLPAGVRLRLDANRAWSLEETRRFLEGLEELPVESLEEPLRHPEIDALRRLQESTPVALALDESVAVLGPARVLASAPVKRLVLKPMVQGGPGRTLELARRSLRAGMTPVITSSLESAVGLHAACQLAAALAAVRPETAHGLATGAWLADDPHRAPRIERGSLHLNDLPGLGVNP